MAMKRAYLYSVTPSKWFIRYFVQLTRIMIVLINNKDKDNDDAIGPESIDNCGNMRKVVGV
jgi:hypothetical protein